MKWPRVIKVKRFAEQLSFVPLGQHDDVRFDLVHLCTRVLPEFSRHLFSNVTTKTIQIKLANPVLQHISHVTSQLGIRVVELGDVAPIMRIGYVASGIVLVKFRPRHHDAVPRRMVRYDIYDHLHPTPMCF